MKINVQILLFEYLTRVCDACYIISMLLEVLHEFCNTRTRALRTTRWTGIIWKEKKRNSVHPTRYSTGTHLTQSHGSRRCCCHWPIFSLTLKVFNWFINKKNQVLKSPWVFYYEMLSFFIYFLFLFLSLFILTRNIIFVITYATRRFSWLYI